MFGKGGFRMGRVFTAVCLVFIVVFISCRVVVFAFGLTWRELVAITKSDHAVDVLGDSFVGVSEFAILGGGDIRIFDGLLVHEVLIDGD